MKVKFKSRKGIDLIGDYYRVENPKAMILINPATAVKIKYYNYFIEFLNLKEFNVFIWNYSCFSSPYNQDLKSYPFKFSDIGHFEIPAAVEKAKSLNPDLPFFCIGHSVGAQHIGFVENRDLIDGLIVAGTSAGYFPYMPFMYSLKAYFFFKVFSPLSSLLYGYVPASKFNFMEDLPSALVKEWGEWCSEKELIFSKNYYGKIVPEGSFKDLLFPIHTFIADDDEICTQRNVENFWKHITSKEKITCVSLKSKTFPRQKLGHFGYFKKINNKFWDDLVDVLEGWLSKK